MPMVKHGQLVALGLLAAICVYADEKPAALADKPEAPAHSPSHAPALMPEAEKTEAPSTPPSPSQATAAETKAPGVKAPEAKAAEVKTPEVAPAASVARKTEKKAEKKEPSEAELEAAAQRIVAFFRNDGEVNARLASSSSRLRAIGDALKVKRPALRGELLSLERYVKETEALRNAVAANDQEKLKIMAEKFPSLIFKIENPSPVDLFEVSRQQLVESEMKIARRLRSFVIKHKIDGSLLDLIAQQTGVSVDDLVPHSYASNENNDRGLSPSMLAFKGAIADIINSGRAPHRNDRVLSEAQNILQNAIARQYALGQAWDEFKKSQLKITLERMLKQRKSADVEEKTGDEERAPASQQVLPDYSDAFILGLARTVASGDAELIRNFNGWIVKANSEQREAMNRAQTEIEDMLAKAYRKEGTDGDPEAIRNLFLTQLQERTGLPREEIQKRLMSFVASGCPGAASIP